MALQYSLSPIVFGQSPSSSDSSVQSPSPPSSDLSLALFSPTLSLSSPLSSPVSVSYGSRSQSVVTLYDDNAVHNNDTVKIMRFVDGAHTSLDATYEKDPHIVVPVVSMTEPVQVVHSLKDSLDHASIGTASLITTSGSSLASISSGFEGHFAPAVAEPIYYRQAGNVRPFYIPNPGSLRPLGRMSRPVRTLTASNKNYQAARYKTELCLHYREHNQCPHGSNCLFAHGLAELRPYRGRHPKHKTQPCRSFHQTGFCNYGYRCSYIHLESPETIRYLRGLNIKAQEVNKCDIRPNNRNRIQFKHKPLSQL